MRINSHSPSEKPRDTSRPCLRRVALDLDASERIRKRVRLDQPAKQRRQDIYSFTAYAGRSGRERVGTFILPCAGAQRMRCAFVGVFSYNSGAKLPRIWRREASRSGPLGARRLDAVAMAMKSVGTDAQAIHLDVNRRGDIYCGGSQVEEASLGNLDVPINKREVGIQPRRGAPLKDNSGASGQR